MKNDDPREEKVVESSASSSTNYSIASSLSDFEQLQLPKTLNPDLAFHEERWGHIKNKQLVPGNFCPSFAVPAVLEDGQVVPDFSREDFQASYVVFVFFPMKVDIEPLLRMLVLEGPNG